MIKNSSVWVEKYRPQELNDLILSDKNRQLLKSCVDKKKIPNLTIFSKDAGIGKTTTAKMLSNMLSPENVLFINGSLERNIDTIRNEMTEFVYSKSMNDEKKLIIIDEADGVNKIAQQSLRGFIEEFSDVCSFILTCNDVNNIIYPIISRCPKLDLTIKSEDRQFIAKQILERCKHILRDNLVEFDERTVAKIIKQQFPDIRSIIELLQRYSISGHFNEESIILSEEVKNVSEIQKLEEAFIDKDWNKIRIWAHDYYNDSVIFDKIYEYFTTRVQAEFIPELILIVGEYSFRHAITNSKEINLSACLTELMNKIKL